MLKENGIPRELIYLIVHNKEQKEMYEAIPKDLYNEILVTNQDKGLLGQWNWLFQHYKKGQKIVKIDDDVSSILELKGDKLVKTNNLKSIIKEGFGLCEKNGYKLWGLYPVPNAFYMKSPDEYSTNLKFIVGAFMGVINEKIEVSLRIKHDYEYSIKSYLENGGLIRFNHIAFKYDIAKKLPERTKLLQADADKLLKMYPEYARLNSNREGEVLLMKGGKITDEIPDIMESDNEEIYYDQIELTPKIKALQEKILSLLEQTKIPTTPNLRKKVVGGNGWTFNMGSGRKKFRPTGEYKANKENPELFKAIVQYGNEILPHKFPYSIITINKNLKAKKHKDGGNAGMSCITFLGDYKGGGLYVYDKNDKPTLYDTHNKVIAMNGATLAHRTEAFTGTRYALIFYNQKHKIDLGVRMMGKGIEEEVMIY